MPQKILLINYYWPPCGGPAVQRWLDITRTLAEAGIQTYVVTIAENLATWPYIDRTLEERVPAGTQVYRTGTSELFGVYKKYIGKGKVPANGLVDEPHPTFMQKVARFVRGNILLPDPRVGWNKHAYKQAAELIATEHIDIVFTAGPPHSTHLVGLQLKAAFPQIKWIADIHDYWTEASYLAKFYRTSLAQYFDKKKELRVLQHADEVMTHCQSSVALQCKKLDGQHCEKLFAFTMGFNEALFATRPVQQQDQFIISYTGIIADHYEPQVFLKALKAAMNRNPEVPVLLRFVGDMSPIVRAAITAEGLEECLEAIPYLPHKEAIEYLYRSSALFLINPKFKNEAIHVPGKLYEYLAVFKPIISISPKGSENEQIIHAMQAGQNFERSDEQGITGYVSKLMQEWKGKNNVDLPYNPAIFRYGRRQEGLQLAERIYALAAPKR